MWHVIHDSKLHAVASGPLSADKSDAPLLTRSEERQTPLNCSRVGGGKPKPRYGTGNEYSQRVRAEENVAFRVRGCHAVTALQPVPFSGSSHTVTVKKTMQQRPKGEKYVAERVGCPVGRNRTAGEQRSNIGSYGPSSCASGREWITDVDHNTTMYCFPETALRQCLLTLL